MAHLSQHDLWGPGDNRVVALPPSPGDVFVITTVDGKRVLVHPVHEYDKAVRIAHAFTRRWRAEQPVTIKVLCLTLKEAQATGFAPADLFRNQTPQEEAEMRRLVTQTCMATLHQSPDSAARGEALKLLQDMGMLQ